jgi:hypothetical protein
MLTKNIKWICLSMLFSFSFANEKDIDNNVLQTLKNYNVEVLNKNDVNMETTIQLIPKSEKEKILKDKIEFLTKDIAQWRVKELELQNVKKDFESKLNNNEENIKIWEQDVKEITEQLKVSVETISKETEEISVGQNLLLKDSEVISVNLADGKKIRLIKYIVFPGDSLSKILVRTFKEGDKIKENLQNRIDTVIKLNKGIKEANSIKVGETIYIPFFK